MKKYLLIGLLLLAMTFVACGTDETKDTGVENPVKDKTEVEVPNDTDEPEVPVDDQDSEVVTEDPVKPDDTEEPVVEMVDWETWATQADNDEVCLVVWNETTGTQEILKPMSENASIYIVQEGDRFAVPRRDNVSYVGIGFETDIYWQSENQKYIEFELPVGEMKQVYIICNDREKAISYLFNY